MSLFSKTLFSKCFRSARIRKAGVFKILRFEERFLKAPFLRRISVARRPNRHRNKVAFSNSYIVWTGPKKYIHQLLKLMHQLPKEVMLYLLIQRFLHGRKKK